MLDKIAPIASGLGNLAAIWQATRQRDPYADMPWLRVQEEASQQALGHQNNAAELFKASMDPKSTAFKNVRDLMLAQKEKEALDALSQQMAMQRRLKARGYGGVRTGTEKRDQSIAWARHRDYAGQKASEETIKYLQGAATGEQGAGTAMGQTAYYGGAGMNPSMMKYALGNQGNTATRFSALATGLESLLKKTRGGPDIVPDVPQRNPFRFPNYELT